MSESSPQVRRLAAVMFLDMVGYSALMSKSESRALSGVRELEALLREQVPAAGGRLIKFMGDGSLAEFPTAGSAVACARGLLDRIAARNAGRSASERLQIRIGLHLGELVEENGDIFGDAVNIAARVEPLADPGGIAMTGTVHAQIKNQFPLLGTYLPPRKLKNIPEKMNIFLVPPEGTSFPLWALRRRGVPAAAGLVVTAAALALAAGGLYRWANPGPVRIGLLYVQTNEAAAAKRMARAIEDELALKVAATPGFLWVDRNGILDLFDQEGLGELARIDKLERKACAVARKGGLQYSLTAKLVPEGSDRWRLESKIVCTKMRAVVGSFKSEGSTPAAMAEELMRQLHDWARGYHLVPA